MSDLQWLLLVLALIYAWECLFWLRRGVVAFRQWGRGAWQIVHPGRYCGNANGGFVLANGLPAAGVLVTGMPCPVSISPEGVLAYVASAINLDWRPKQTGRFIRFAEARQIEVKGRRVFIDGKLFLAAGSSTAAAGLRSFLKQLQALPQPERAVAISEHFHRSLHTQRLKARWEEYRRQARPLRFLSATLFVYLAVLTPGMLWYFGFKGSWWQLLAGLLLQTVTTSVLFHRAHRHLYPEAEEERFNHAATMLLSPPSAIRAFDVLAHPLLEGFHPLAIARVFCAEERFRAFARGVWTELQHPAWPVCPVDTEAARATESFSREALSRAVADFLKANGVEVAELLPTPQPAEAACRAYCPRCRTQYTTASGHCGDCGGLPLVAF